MAEFIVVGFNGQFQAMKTLKEMKQAGEMDYNIEASAVVSRNEKGEILVDSPKEEQERTVESAVAGSIIGGAAGLLIGAITANPGAGLLAGTAIGGVAGAGAGDLTELGIDDKFNREVGQMLDLDSSAICFLLWDQAWDELPGRGLEMIKQAGGKVIKTSLSVTDEKELTSRLRG